MGARHCCKHFVYKHSSNLTIANFIGENMELEGCPIPINKFRPIPHVLLVMISYFLRDGISSLACHLTYLWSRPCLPHLLLLHPSFCSLDVWHCTTVPHSATTLSSFLLQAFARWIPICELPTPITGHMISSLPLPPSLHPPPPVSCLFPSASINWEFTLGNSSF